MHRAEWSAGDQLMAAARLKVYVCACARDRNSMCDVSATSSVDKPIFRRRVGSTGATGNRIIEVYLLAGQYYIMYRLWM